MKLERYPELHNKYLVRTITHHRIWFSRSCLTICKETAVVTFPSIGQNLHTDFLKDFSLICVLFVIGAASMKQLHKVAFFVRSELIMWPEGIVEGEISEFGWVLSIKYSCGISDHIDAYLTVKIDFSLIKRSNSNTYFNTHILNINNY